MRFSTRPAAPATGIPLRSRRAVSQAPRDPRSGPGPKVFITYRREETGAHAGRLYDAMVSRFGEGNVFMDVDMAPGVDFVERITEAVAACHVLIVVMGPRWATVEDKQGRRRLADPEDFVRLEVETALRRSEVIPIPVLVAGAEMPSREDLPSGLRAITRRNAFELSDQRWRTDIGRLIGTIDELLEEPAGPPARERSGAARAEASGAVAETPAPASAARPGTPAEAKPAARPRRDRRWLRWAGLGGLAIVAIVLAVVIASGGGGGGGAEAQIAGVIERSFLSTDPADCTKLNTQRFLQQTYFLTGQDAVNACAAEAKNLATHPDSVDVSDVRVTVSGDGATAEARFQGGLYDGQTMILSLLKDGAQWKLYYVNDYKDFDLNSFAAAFAATTPKFAVNPLPQGKANCAAAEYRRLPPATVEAGVLSGDPDKLLPRVVREACGI
jgi:hypothetical protein